MNKKTWRARDREEKGWTNPSHAQPSSQNTALDGEHRSDGKTMYSQNEANLCFLSWRKGLLFMTYCTARNFNQNYLVNIKHEIWISNITEICLVLEILYLFYWLIGCFVCLFVDLNNIAEISINVSYLPIYCTKSEFSMWIETYFQQSTDNSLHFPFTIISEFHHLLSRVHT